MSNPFTDHPHHVGETYLQHLRFASGFGLKMIGGGLACVIHGLFPFLFTTTGSRTIRGLHDIITAPRGDAHPAPTPTRQPAE
jgi:hypothetical protein